MIRFLSIAACLFLFSSCRCSDSPDHPKVETERVEQKDQASDLSYDMKEIRVAYNNCDGDFQECTQVFFFYPNFNKEDLAGINALVLSTISNPELSLKIEPEINSQSLADSANQFINSYADFRSEFEETSQSWFWIAEVEVIQELESLFTLKFSMEIFSGGAHQIVKEQYLNVLNGGKLVVTDEVFSKDSELPISKEIAKAFRKQELLGPDQSLTQAGLFKNEIPFTKNLKIGSNGVLFHYNPYEIAPWTTGPIDVVVSYSSLESYIEPKWFDIIKSSNRIN